MLQGKTIHEQHHQKTYFHVSLDPPWLILSVMGVAAAVFWLVFWGGPLALTATSAYYAAGMLTPLTSNMPHDQNAHIVQVSCIIASTPPSSLLCGRFQSVDHFQPTSISYAMHAPVLYLSAAQHIELRCCSSSSIDAAYHITAAKHVLFRLHL